MISELISIFGGSVSKMWGGIIVFVAIVGYVGFLHWHIHTLETAKANLQTQLANQKLEVERQKGMVQTCNGKIDVTNNRIADLKKDNEFRNKTLNMLSQNIDQYRKNTEAAIKDLSNAPTPQTCTAALDFLRQGIGTGGQNK